MKKFVFLFRGIQIDILTFVTTVGGIYIGNAWKLIVLMKSSLK